ncbi:ovochymase-like [Amphiura filiformis]|uniref:ovochymase-like n=1 Tax=Amphiura filiformis TaxID=82378 RepID=UPI003B215DDF
MDDDYKGTGQWLTNGQGLSDNLSFLQPRTGRKCYYCLTFIMTLLILLIILFIAATGVFYWYIFVYRGSVESRTYLEVPILVRLDVDFVDEFYNSSSPEYTNLTSSYTNEVDKLFKNTNYEETYLQTNVVSLTPGSVRVNSSSFFRNDNSVDQKSSTDRKETLENLRKDIEEIINNELSNGKLGETLPVTETSSLVVETPIIVEQLPNTIQTTTMIPTTEMPTTTTHRSTTAEVTPTKTPTMIRTTVAPSSCQSPGDVRLTQNTPYDLFSPNYPAAYPSNTVCIWYVRAPSTAQRVRAHFNFVYLEDGVDFLYVGTGPGEGYYNKLSHTGITQQVPLDVISPEDLLVITFESSPTGGAQGFSIRFEAVDPPGNDLVTCDNGLEVLVADDICDSRIECDDGSDETDCHDLLRTEICGTNLPLTRILGGQDVALGSMPWMSSVRTATGAHYCGATLLSEQWAITAAHCINYTDHLSIGGISLDTSTDYEERIPISAIFAHPGYNLTSGNPDVALIRLARPVKISAATRPICVAHVTEDADEADIYTNCKALGWGAPNHMGGLSPVLKEVTMPLIPRDECTAISEDSQGTKICAGNRPNSNTCTGDNGGPLVCRGQNGLWHIVGVTTRSSHCMPSVADVYTRISALHNFILYTVTQTDACIGTAFEPFCLEGCVGGDDCRTQCGDDQVKCNVGNCIDNTKTCDGIADCIDATDEGVAQSCTTEGCGGEFTFRQGQDTYTITSPGYPNEYKSLQRCQWRISTTAGNRIKLRFNEFITERGYDILHIGNLNSESLLSLSGDYLPLDVLSVDNTMTVTFESDYALEMGGFSVQATSISENQIGTLTTCSNGMQILPAPQMRNIMCNGIPECFDNSDELQCACGDAVRNVPLDGFISIQSQNFGSGGYPDFTIPCEWIVIASSPERRLEVTFNEFATESGYDFVSIATGRENSATVVSYSGHTIPPKLVSPASELIIKFTTDHTGGAEGFQLLIQDISVEQSNGEPKCRNNFERLEPENSCDGIPHCSDGSDELDECKCGNTFYLVPDGGSSNLNSARFPSNYFQISFQLFPLNELSVVRNPSKI